MEAERSTEMLSALLAKCDGLLEELAQMHHQLMATRRQTNALRERIVEVLDAIKTPPV